MKFAGVIVDISHEKLDRIFQYIIPEALEEVIKPGCRVDISFGNSKRIITGYVVEITDKPDYDVDKMKTIIGISKGSLKIESELVALAAWMKEHTGSTLNQALKTVIPIKRQVKAVNSYDLLLNVSGNEYETVIAKYQKRSSMRKRVELLLLLKEKGTVDRDEAVKLTKISLATLKAMEEEGVIKSKSNKVYRTPLVIENATKSDALISLNEEQQKVVNDILSDIEKGDKRPHLIFGVTGSGKTEVYMELIEKVISEGKQVIVLIPEISLTYQTVMRFYNRFGGRIAVINSKLSYGEKCDQFEKAREGLADVMIGPRSALFTPFKNLGMIIVDEEQENSYKSETSPRYHAVDTAIERARISGANVVLGSATPSISSYYKAKQGLFILHKLENRVFGRSLADVSVVDMREELRRGNKTIFSDKLYNLIKDRLAKKEQVIIFINRRGYANFMSCRSCGKAIKCPHCDVTLKYHNDKMLRCHYCGHTVKAPTLCPECGSKFIAPFGTGTQKVEQMVKDTFKEARVLRMDTDTTSKKNGYNDIIKSFANHEADILVGTQMIVKGHDFSKVTLVGIVAADLSLYASSFKASENTFKLLTQAAGRAGRGEIRGDVVIQTYSPDEYSIVASAHQDYEEFYEQEMAFRSLMKYPPAVGMLTIQIASQNEEFAVSVSKKIGDFLEKNKELKIMGPSKASVYKINDIFRYLIYVKGGSNLLKICEEIDEYIKDEKDISEVNLQYDLENV